MRSTVCGYRSTVSPGTKNVAGNEYSASRSRMRGTPASALQVPCRVDGAAHARLHGSVGLDQPFLRRALERRPMEVALPEVLVPRVGVRVELHERERPMLARQHAQLGERDRMVAAHRRREDLR